MNEDGASSSSGDEEVLEEEEEECVVLDSDEEEQGAKASKTKAKVSGPRSRVTRVQRSHSGQCKLNDLQHLFLSFPQQRVLPLSSIAGWQQARA